MSLRYDKILSAPADVTGIVNIIFEAMLKLEKTFAFLLQ